MTDTNTHVAPWNRFPQPKRPTTRGDMTGVELREVARQLTTKQLMGDIKYAREAMREEARPNYDDLSYEYPYALIVPNVVFCAREIAVMRAELYRRAA